MRPPVAALALALGSAWCAACSVYWTRLDPPPRLESARYEPLDLTLSLGDVRAVEDGAPVALDAATLARIEAEFMEAVRAAGLVRAVLPRGSHADLHCDVTRERHQVTTGGDVAYQVLAGPLAFLAPGFPYPWRHRVAHVVTLRGEVGGTSMPLGSRRVAHEERVWGANWWGGRGGDPRRARDGAYLAAALESLAGERHAALAGFASAVRAGDVETAWVLGRDGAGAP